MATIAYFTVPKIFNYDPRFADLSVNAQYLYSYMRDVRQLSLKNNWRDKLGVYIKLTRQKMADLLKVSLPTLRKVLHELKQLGLIIDLRMGLTRCNRIYVQLLPGESEADFQPRQKETSSSKEKPGFTPDRNGFSPNKPNSNNRNLIDPKNKRWFIKEGDKWMDGNGEIWEFSDGDVHPFYTRSALSRLVGEALPEFAL